MCLTRRVAGAWQAGQVRVTGPPDEALIFYPPREGGVCYGETGVTGVAPLIANPSSTISGVLPGKSIRAPGDSR
jgi:hypothetical protein